MLARPDSNSSVICIFEDSETDRGGVTLLLESGVINLLLRSGVGCRHGFCPRGRPAPGTLAHVSSPGRKTFFKLGKIFARIPYKRRSASGTMPGMGLLQRLPPLQTHPWARRQRAMETAAAVEIEQGSLRRLLLDDFHKLFGKSLRKKRSGFSTVTTAPTTAVLNETL